MVWSHWWLLAAISSAGVLTSDANRLLYVTFHGGSSSDDINTVYAYNTSTGEFVGDVFNATEGYKPPLDHLRCLYVQPTSGNLYVCNSHDDNSAIYIFSPPQSSHSVGRQFLGAYITDDVYPLIEHPYAFIQKDSDSSTYFLVSQHKGTVFQFQGDNQGYPKPIPSSLRPPNYPADTFPPGIFVPNASAANPSSHGLEDPRDFAIDCSVEKMYVTDESCNCVKIFNLANGSYVRKLTYKHLKSPIQLVWDSSCTRLYIGSKDNNEIIMYDKTSDQMSRFVRKKDNAGLDSPSGLLLDEAEGWMYVGSREGKQILRYRLADGKADNKPFIDNLLDNPEFLAFYPQAL